MSQGKQQAGLQRDELPSFPVSPALLTVKQESANLATGNDLGPGQQQPLLNRTRSSSKWSRSGDCRVPAAVDSLTLTCYCPERNLCLHAGEEYVPSPSTSGTPGLAELGTQPNSSVRAGIVRTDYGERVTQLPPLPRATPQPQSGRRAPDKAPQRYAHEQLHTTGENAYGCALPCRA